MNGRKTVKNCVKEEEEDEEAKQREKNNSAIYFTWKIIKSRTGTRVHV